LRSSTRTATASSARQNGRQPKRPGRSGAGESLPGMFSVLSECVIDAAGHSRQ
jgi:hypothetical protein